MSSSIEPTKPTLDELFSRDPLSLLDQDIDTIIEALRAARQKFASEESAPKAKPAKLQAPAQLSLDDIELQV